jgi:hypothetical protein
MFGSFIVYSGLLVAAVGAVCVAKPVRRLRIRTRPQGLAVIGAGMALAAIGATLPAPESRIDRPRSRLDELAPVWQFNERHHLHIAAPPARVYDAIHRVRADEITLFRTLTWIRRGGRAQPENILNAGARDSLIDVATHSGFVLLADEAPRELVVGAAVVTPRGVHKRALTADDFRRPLPPGFALATMNFSVQPDDAGGSLLTTETRVFANSPGVRRRFAVYWRVIYPGSALIRIMWLRAISRRATSA